MKRKIYKPEVHNVKSSDRCQQCHLEGSDQEYTLYSQIRLQLHKMLMSIFYYVDIQT